MVIQIIVIQCNCFHGIVSELYKIICVKISFYCCLYDDDGGRIWGWRRERNGFASLSIFYHVWKNCARIMMRGFVNFSHLKTYFMLRICAVQWLIGRRIPFFSYFFIVIFFTLNFYSVLFYVIQISCCFKFTWLVLESTKRSLNVSSFNYFLVYLFSTNLFIVHSIYFTYYVIFGRFYYARSVKSKKINQ